MPDDPPSPPEDPNEAIRRLLAQAGEPEAPETAETTPETTETSEAMDAATADILRLDEEREKRKTQALHSKNRARRQAAGGGNSADAGGEFLPLGDKTFRPLPPDCPVTCLGTQNEIYYFIDSIGQFVAKKISELTQVGVDGLFKDPAANQWIEAHYGRFSRGVSRDGRRWLLGIERDLLRRALIARCGERGIFDPTDRLRGVGAWRGPDGELIWHFGDEVWRQDKEGRIEFLAPGMIERIVYPLGDAQDRPADAGTAACSRETATGEWEGPGGELLNLLLRWAWKRGPLDARLYLGCMVAAMVGGALKWRPNSYVIGPYAAGKSELQNVAIAVMGGPASVVYSADASGAGVRQVLRGRSLPVTLDEVEASTDNTRRQAIMELARVAASGGKFTRGGSAHEATEWTVRSCFFFTSILPLPMLPADLSRLIMLELGRPDRRRLIWSVQDVREAGALVRRRVLDAWPAFEATILEPFRAWLADRVGGRSADVYGTALAMQHVALHDGPPDAATVEALCAPLVADLLALRETDGDEHDQCLAHLLGGPVEVGEKRLHFSLLTTVLLAAHLRGPAVSRLEREGVSLPDIAPATARLALNARGLNLVNREDRQWLALALRGSAVDRFFRGTRWQAGVWAKALGRLDGADGRTKQRISGPPERCLLLPLGTIVGDDLEMPTAPVDAGAVDDEDEPL